MELLTGNKVKLSLSPLKIGWLTCQQCVFYQIRFGKANNMLTVLEVGGSVYRGSIGSYGVCVIISFHFNAVCINTHVPTHTHTQREREMSYCQSAFECLRWCKVPAICLVMCFSKGMWALSQAVHPAVCPDDPSCDPDVNLGF